MVFFNSLRAGISTGLRTAENDIAAIGQFFDNVTSFR